MTEQREVASNGTQAAKVLRRYLAVEKAQKRQMNMWVSEETAVTVGDVAEELGWSRGKVVEVAVEMLVAILREERRDEDA